MTPIQLTPTGEKLFSRTPERSGGYVEIVEQFYVDQYGHEWHSFHKRFVADREGVPQDKSPTERYGFNSHQF